MLVTPRDTCRRVRSMATHSAHTRHTYRARAGAAEGTAAAQPMGAWKQHSWAEVRALGEALRAAGCDLRCAGDARVCARRARCAGSRRDRAAAQLATSSLASSSELGATSLRRASVAIAANCAPVPAQKCWNRARTR